MSNLQGWHQYQHSQITYQKETYVIVADTTHKSPPDTNLYMNQHTIGKCRSCFSHTRKYKQDHCNRIRSYKGNSQRKQETFIFVLTYQCHKILQEAKTSFCSSLAKIIVPPVNDLTTGSTLTIRNPVTQRMRKAYASQHTKSSPNIPDNFEHQII